MPQPVPPELVKAFGSSAGAGFITNPIPVPSQISTDPGAASLTDGFPPQCFLDVALGGVPPEGADFNGILYMISAAVSAMNAGQFYKYSATLSTAMGGYKLGALLLKADGSGFWFNLLEGNTSDPDASGANWQSWVPA